MIRTKISAFVCSLTACIMLTSQLTHANPGSIIIIVQQDPVITPIGAPRSPVNIPFFAELMDEYVVLGASCFCGTASVQLTSPTGDDYFSLFDTSDGAILLPISGASGNYTLAIATSDGRYFIGEFFL